MNKVNNGHTTETVTVRVAKPMLLDGTVLIDRDIEAIVEKLNDCGACAYSVYPIYDYPRGPVPEVYLKEYLEALDACVRKPNKETSDKLSIASVRLRGIAKMGNNSYIGAPGQKLSEHWKNQGRSNEELK